MTADGSPPPLDPGSLREGLVGPDRSWRRLEVIEETGSTNADLIARAASGEDIAGLVLLAENQTAGRGRSGRTWSAVPRAQVTMSVGVAVDGVDTERWGWIPLAAGVAVVDAVHTTTGIRVGLKWPNDVLANGGKLAGILAEVASPRPVVVVGIGLNASLRPGEIAEPSATSLRALGATVDRNELVRVLLIELAARFGSWRAADGADAELAADYRARSSTIGSRVRVVLPGERELIADAVGVDERGRLCVDTGSELLAVSAGDIVHLLPMLEG